MPVEIILPKVDMDMATGRIARWFVQEGARVKKGDLLFEIETDKATMEIDSPVDGLLRDVSGKEGVDIPVGQPVAWIFAEGEEGGGLQAPVDGVTLADPQEIVALPEATVSAFTSPLWGGRAEGAGGGSDRDGATPTPDLRSDPSHRGEGEVRASPLARRMAKERGIDLSGVTGSGPLGRIVRADIEAAKLATTVPVGAPGAVVEDSDRTAPSPRSAADDPILRNFAEGSYRLVPHDGPRLATAQRLALSKRTVPHFYLTVDCELDAILSLRTRINEALATAPGRAADTISINDLLIKALALSLRDLPEANVSWSDSGMLRHRQVDIGVAMPGPDGVMTPIIRNAGTKSLSAISSERKDFLVRTRERALLPQECQGGTTAISNLGRLGPKTFSAVIDPPHATMLSVGAADQRPVVRDGEVVVATVASMTLSTDHRAVDGALGAELMTIFKRYIEHPIALLA